MEPKIDFVLIWVDGNDKDWQAQRSRYSPSVSSDGGENRYRDWDNLQYWFRGVEKYAPWVNKIFFITCGHHPGWLNLDHPKLEFVKHSEYLPAEYLPTFSSHPIELNFHRIEGLSEKFVYFNDDMFIINPVMPTDFFKNGLPCDGPKMMSIIGSIEDLFPHILLNTIGVINSKFLKHKVIKENWRNWFNPRYGLKNLVRNLFFYAMSGEEFPGFVFEHLPAPFLKSTFDEAWEEFGEILHETSLRKFRDILDVNQYLFRYLQFVNGKFWPNDTDKLGHNYSLPSNADRLFASIDHGMLKMVCANDTKLGYDADTIMHKLNIHFEKKFPEKSAFEL